ncbi:MAG: transporter permease, partial [Acidimicrobiales bacterium]|nr:transporter permease [Acidimicrobiales bacterium]
ARRAELDRGVDVDGPVLALGAVAVVLHVCAWAAGAAWRATAAAARLGATAARPSASARLLARARLPVTGWTGLTLAAGRGRAGTAGLRRAAVVVAGITVVVVTAAVAFAASLDALGEEPEDYGVTWDVSVGEAGSPEQSGALEDGLRRDGDVAALTGITGEGLTVGEEGEVGAMVLFGDEVVPRVVAGRAPRGPDEIAFAGQTLEDLGVVVGDRVPVGIDGTRSLVVTGEVVLNGAGLLDDLEDGEGALLPDPAQQLLVAPEDRELSFPSTYLVRLEPGADREAVVARLARENPRTVVGPVTPSQVDNIERVAGLPALLAALVAVLGTGTIVHATVTTVRRRRRDLAMLAGLGFLRRQVAATLAWQATAVAAVALLVGLPLGVAIGRWSWRLTADALWVVSTPEIPVPALVLVAVAAVVVVNAAALVAAALVRRGSLSAALRAE